MPLFTNSELELKKSQSPVEKKQQGMAPKKRKKKLVIIEYEKARRYFHNELRGELKVFYFDIDGTLYPCLCKDGLIDAKNKKLCKYLESIGFRFVKEIDDEDFDQDEYLEYEEEEEDEHEQ